MNLFGKRTNLDAVTTNAGPERSSTHKRLKRRRIFLNLQPPKSMLEHGNTTRYPSNMVRTSKYTLLTFLPKNIIEQFRGIANFYFLSLVILQIFPMFATVDILVTAAPIVIIVGATAFKDAIEDWKRHEADSEVNMANTYVLSNWKNLNFAEKESVWFATFIESLGQVVSKISALVGKIISVKKPRSSLSPVAYPPDIKLEDYLGQEVVTEVPSSASDSWKIANWKDIRVGDFVFLRNKDRIPADIVIVSSSEPDSLCYVETKNLDGETNLKIRKGILELSWVKTPSHCNQIKGFLDTEQPNNSLEHFNGVLCLDDETQLPIGSNGLLLRGSVLRNTGWIIGIVAFTGQETKIMLNSGDTPSKRSRVDRQINPHILLNFWILSCLCLICGLISSFYNDSFQFEKAAFMGVFDGDFNSSFLAGILTFFNCLIIFQNLIPIALYISLEATKSAQSFLIHSDEDMYDKESDKKVQPKSWNLCDDLGQIEYVFTDKTGTLTSNTMEFRKASINGVAYGKTYSGPNASDQYMETRTKMYNDLGKLVDKSKISIQPSFVDPIIAEHLKEGGIQASRIREFFTLLALCHTVLVDKPKMNMPDITIYNAQSPDEAALVSASRDMGFEFLGRKNNDVTISILGEKRVYSILHIMEFNSDRKRMSVIVKRPEGQIVLLCKGADSVIYERLSDDNNADFTERTLNHLSKFANEGLRTLCLAYKIISDVEYKEWEPKYRKAQTCIVDREKECDAVSELIERDLILMGATAIEDKLQEGVPQAIATLFKAGIKLWVLTGDKMETAVNIGFSCNLLRRDMILIVIKSTSKEETKNQLVEALTRFWGANSQLNSNQAHSLIIDGTSLSFALDPMCKALLLELGCRCRTVICCRVSPLQKAMTVRLVRDGLGAMCLAIGDGANDVSMIQEADIGIGISGKEGVQAVNASDYAISQFRFIVKLLLVHGKWAYVRSSSMVLNYFYKNVVWLLILFWHQFYSGVNGGLVTDFTYSIFFNTVFTFLPTILIGIFDQDLNDNISQNVPQLYSKGIRQELYGTNQFWIYFGHAVYQSIVCYYVGYYIASSGSLDRDGHDIDLSAMGTLIAFGAIIVINLFSVFSWSNWTWITVMSIILSLLSWVAYILAYSSSVGSPVYGIKETLLVSPIFYAGLLIMVILSLLPRIIIKYLQQQLDPTDTDILKEINSIHRKDVANFFLGRAENPQTTTNYTTMDRSHHSHPETNAAGEVVDSAGKLSKCESHDKLPSKEFQTDPRLGQSSNNSADMLKVVDPENSMNRSRSDHRLVKDKKKQLSSEKPSDGFGADVRDRYPKKLANINEASKSRPPSSSSFGQAIRKAGDFMKRFGLNPNHGLFNRASSLIYMGGNGKQVFNTGYAFSHDTGMEDVITPKRMNLDPLEDEKPAGKKGKTTSIASSLKLQNISNKIQSALGLKTKEVVQKSDKDHQQPEKSKGKETNEIIEQDNAIGENSRKQNAESKDPSDSKH